MTNLQKDARIAGALYLMVALTGPFVLLYVPGKLFVPGDATSTANNIFTHQSLFKAYVVVGLFSELFFLATVLALYRLLKEVDRTLANIMVITVLIDAPLAFVGLANQLATLTFVQGADFLSVFDKAQRDVIATFLIMVDRQGIAISQLFWGFWLFPLAMLVYRSGFFPRFLGVWLFLNGLAYLATSFTGMLIPQHLSVVNKGTLPLLLGEVAFLLWLLIVGAKQKLVNEITNEPGQLKST
ncbi:MAG TPA: DUF4386 domain-containing protein [Bacteroidota bacterium]|nr:DUF4386 domain-containing protein [Bacteroidota bacterium]